MINGVLVERTVQDVIPALKTNSEGLRKVLEDLVKQYNTKQTEMEKWKVRWKPNANGRRRGQSADLYICYTEEEQHPGRAAISAKNCNGLRSTELRQDREDQQNLKISNLDWVIRRSII